jgi:hypothetical protein
VGGGGRGHRVRVGGEPGRGATGRDAVRDATAEVEGGGHGKHQQEVRPAALLPRTPGLTTPKECGEEAEGPRGIRARGGGEDRAAGGRAAADGDAQVLGFSGAGVALALAVVLVPVVRRERPAFLLRRRRGWGGGEE